MIDEWGNRDTSDSFNEAAAQQPEPAGGNGPAQGGEGVRDGVDETDPKETKPTRSDGSAKVTSDIFSRDPNRPLLKKVFNEAARSGGGTQGEGAGTGGNRKTDGSNSSETNMEPGGSSRPKPLSP